MTSEAPKTKLLSSNCCGLPPDPVSVLPMITIVLCSGTVEQIRRYPIQAIVSGVEGNHLFLLSAVPPETAVQRPISVLRQSIE